MSVPLAPMCKGVWDAIVLKLQRGDQKRKTRDETEACLQNREIRGPQEPFHVGALLTWENWVGGGRDGLMTVLWVWIQLAVEIVLFGCLGSCTIDSECWEFVFHQCSNLMYNVCSFQVVWLYSECSYNDVFRGNGTLVSGFTGFTLGFITHLRSPLSWVCLL